MEPEAESVRQPRLPFLRGKKAVRQVDTYRLSRGREAPAECGCRLLLGACTTVCQWWLFAMEPEMFFSHKGPCPNFITKKQRNYNVLMGKEYRTTYYKIAEIQTPRGCTDCTAAKHQKLAKRREDYQATKEHKKHSHRLDY
jgi:hypothetical protein